MTAAIAKGTITWDEETQGPPPADFTGRVNYLTRFKKQSHRYMLDGEMVTGVTTIIGDGVNKGDVLQRWASKLIAEAAYDTKAYWSRLPRDDVKEGNRTIEGAVTYLKNAPYRKTNEQGIKGTEVHGIAEHFAETGTLPNLGDVAPVIRGQVEALGRFLTDFEVEVLLSEVVLFNRVELYAGTCDLVARITHPELGSVVALLDYKTSKSIYKETALQLAAYRYADFYLCPSTGQRLGVPGVQFTGAVHLPAEPKEDQPRGYSLVPLQADRPVYRTFLEAKKMAAFHKNGDRVVGKQVLPVARESDILTVCVEQAAITVKDEATRG